MKFDPRIHHRRSIRLKGYDYRQAGGYFVTMVTQGRDMLFGEVVNGEMILNDAGEMIVRWWLELPNKFPNVNVDIFVVMPNHFHGIIFIMDERFRRRRGRPPCRPWFAAIRAANIKGEHGGSPHDDSPPIRPDEDSPNKPKRAVIADDPMVQNDDDQRIHSRSQTIGMETVQRQSLATGLLRAHHSQPIRRGQDRPLHRIQSSAME